MEKGEIVLVYGDKTNFRGRLHVENSIFTLS